MAMWRIALLCVASQCAPRVVAKKSQLDIDLEEPRKILSKYFGKDDDHQLTQDNVKRLGSMSQEDQAAFAKMIGWTNEEWRNYVEGMASKTPEEFRAREIPERLRTRLVPGEARENDGQMRWFESARCQGPLVQVSAVRWTVRL